MKSVSVKQLQNDLNHYLDEVRSGEEVLVKERNKPVVKLVLLNGNGKPGSSATRPAAKRNARKLRKLPPLKDDPLYMSDEEFKEHEAKMVAEGSLTLPKIEPTLEFWEEFFKEPRPNIPLNEILQLINEDRDED